MPSATTDTKAAIREVLAAMPAGQQVRDGHRLQWGPPGNKARAIALAARLGHTFNPTCQSCEADLYHVLRHTVR